MAKDFEWYMPHLLRHEGGYVDDPRDPGGRTNMGITQATYEQWIGRSATEAEMKSLLPGDVAPIYKTLYWDKVRGDELPPGVDYVMFDYSVLHGRRAAVKSLQRVLGLNDDGIIGPLTMRAAKDANPETLITELCNARLEYLMTRPHWPTYGKGWTRRINEVEQTALAIAGERKS